MNARKFSEAMNEVDGRYVEEAVRYKKRAVKSVRFKWGAMAACLCTLIVGIAVWQGLNVPSSPGSGGVKPGGSVPEGIDPILSSIAVYPASEDIQDVANATVEDIGEAAAYSTADLGAYLPSQLPDGYTFGNAGLYETTMKNGTKYNMLRVTYHNEATPAPAPDDGKEAAAREMAGKSFVVFVMNYKPLTDKEIYDIADVSESTLEKIMTNGTFHLSFGDVYIGISPDSAQTAREMLTIIQAVNP